MTWPCFGYLRPLSSVSRALGWPVCLNLASHCRSRKSAPSSVGVKKEAHTSSAPKSCTRPRLRAMPKSSPFVSTMFQKADGLFFLFLVFFVGTGSHSEDLGLSWSLRGLFHHGQHVLRRISQRPDRLLRRRLWRSATLPGGRQVDYIRHHQFRRGLR